MEPTAEKLKELKDDIATVESLLDQAQAHYDRNRHLWNEAIAWEVQARIDRQRFEVEAKKITVKLLEVLVK